MLQNTLCSNFSTENYCIIGNIIKFATDMREIKGLSFEMNKKYKAAIDAGYFDSYEDSPQEWRHTFIGRFLYKWPHRTSTVKRLEGIIGHLPTWDDLTDDVIDDFVMACEESGMTMSSAKTYCSELKGILNANKRKVPSQDFNDKLTLQSEKSQHVYLTREEISRLIRYQVIGDIERFIRRNFIVECLTGARLCDAVRMTINNCDRETGTLSYVPDKTPNIIVTVPVDEGMCLRNFLADKYRRECCVDVFNDILRRMCKACRIDEVKTLKRKGKLVTGPKWQFVSSHTGRRSFATNLYLAGVSIEDIALMMGHGKNIDTTKNYICAERMLSRDVMSYFQPKDYIDSYAEDNIAC